ncbi:Sensor protein CitS [Listeria grayi]|nr:GHKL domain-containing protein [Listeria grayi]EUJ28599.1 hypothetical protein LMUR_05852 [Listeria grayi FSL F6-1183]MBC1921940.1 GHKL domain-containing protein [Listeria grayi]STY44727.1 Sensor protein CitS [Listeria grayi]VEI30328.1 Sensor protein CitS [Listeria grayi]
MLGILVGTIQILAMFFGVQILANSKYNKLEGAGTLVLALCALPLFGLIKYWATFLLALILAISLFIKNRRVIYSISIALLTVILLVVSDSITNLVLIEMSGLDFQKASSSLFSRLIYSLVMFLIVIGLALLIRKLLNHFRLERFIEYRKYGYILFTIIVITVIAFYVNIYAGSMAGFSTRVLQSNTLLFTGYVLVLAVIVTIILRVATREIQMQNQKQQMEQLQEYVETLEVLHKDMRVFRHDYINILSSLVGYIDNDDMAGLKRYFENNIVPLNKAIESNNYKISLLQNIHVVELKGLVAVKLIRAQELKVDAIIEVVEPIEKINMDMIDLCKTVGILLDNAVEAALLCEKPFIRVAVVKQEESTVIAFANSLPAEIPPIYKMFEEGFSTKGTNRGLGLSTLREVIQGYSNVTLDTRITEREFIQELEII